MARATMIQVFGGMPCNRPFLWRIAKGECVTLELIFYPEITAIIYSIMSYCSCNKQFSSVC